MREPKSSVIPPGRNLAILTIAQGLNLYTLQGVAVSPIGFGVPTLDGEVLQISPMGEIVPLVNLQTLQLGIPFAIAADHADWVVTTSDYFPNHHLVRVSPAGKVTPIADLSELSGDAGAPFGVTVSNGDYIVTLSTDVVEATGLLLRVSATGVITKIAELIDGNPFGVVTMGKDFVVAHSKGQLLRVTPQGEKSLIFDVQRAGFGLPFGVAVWNDNLLVTTNLGWVVTVDRQGKGVAIVDLLKAGFGVPSGIAVSDHGVIVTTNSGYLLKIVGQP